MNQSGRDPQVRVPASQRARPTLVPPCPVCGYNLRGVVEAGGSVCPECGWEFTAQDLALLGPSNPKGEPISLKPRESRMKGPWLLAILAVISAALVILSLVLARL